MGEPYYVKAIQPETGVVQICRKAGLQSQIAVVRGVNWLVEVPETAAPGAGGCPAQVKIRARSPAVPARIAAAADGVYEVHFEQPVELSLHSLDNTDGNTVGSLADQDEARRQERLQEIHDGAISHPVVQSAARILGGEVKKVTPLATGDEG